MSMRVLMSPMAWGRGWGPIINLHGLAQSLADRGATIGFAGSDRAISFLSEGTNWPMFTHSPRSEDAIIRFDDRAAAAELVYVRGYAANARLRGGSDA